MIAARFRETDVTLGVLIEEYRCGYETMVGALLTQMSKRKYRALARKRLGRSIATQFKFGFTLWNKGKVGWYPKGSEVSRFKPGCIRGNAARKYKHVGSISIRRDHAPRRTRDRINARPGPERRYIKVRDDGPPQERWVPLARYCWEKEHGPIPAGMLVVHIDGDTMNDKPDNLGLMDRAGNLKRLAAIRPRAWQRCLENRAKAARRRHAENRKLKASLGRTVITWLCVDCGETFEQRPEQCPKCRTSHFEPVQRRERPLAPCLSVSE
jgi:hypothetical protein